MLQRPARWKWEPPRANEPSQDLAWQREKWLQDNAVCTRWQRHEKAQSSSITPCKRINRRLRISFGSRRQRYYRSEWSKYKYCLSWVLWCSGRPWSKLATRNELQVGKSEKQFLRASQHQSANCSATAKPNSVHEWAIAWSLFCGKFDSETDL